MTTVVAIDEGTTGVRAIAVDERGRLVGSAYREFRQIYPKPGWVEHDPEEIWQATLAVLREAVTDPGGVAAIGVTNQRETVVIWDRKTGRPVYNAIVWQCRRTSDSCERLKARGFSPLIRKKTGLVIDAYFSATKVEWILKNIRPKGDLCFGTIDSWLIWNLTGGKVHATDPTNASRTMLYHIDRRDWDPELLKLFKVPRAMLPEVRGSTASYGTTSLLGREIPLFGNAGDQQAALYGQGCVTKGAMKNTYGTGCFMMIHSGARRVDSKAGLLTTLACGPRGETSYALEGAVFIAGAAIQYLRDSLKIIDRAEETEALAASIASTGGVYLVPAFVGLGAPYWDAEARGAIVGLTRGSGRAEIVRAALESIAYQTRDMIEAGGVSVRELLVDGGATSNNFLMQFQADLLGARIVRPKSIGATSMGAACLAGVGAGVWTSRQDLGLEVDRVFTPAMPRKEAKVLFAGWKKAVSRVLSGSRSASRNG
ncbi:MAG TPA: glycerol kinase GlpK [Planctomycetota bacterium]|nr:glycerol kinase GlpK [Planctomycetota bacterium]